MANAKRYLAQISKADRDFESAQRNPNIDNRSLDVILLAAADARSAADRENMNIRRETKTTFNNYFANLIAGRYPQSEINSLEKAAREIIELNKVYDAEFQLKRKVNTLKTKLGLY